MKRALLLLVCCLLTSALLAAPVSAEQAKQVASQFLTSKGHSHRAAAVEQWQASTVLDATDASGRPYLYAVSTGETGYVLVSGDDRMRPVLGYSDSGSLDLQDMPDNMRAWLQGYVNEMRHLDAIGYQPTAAANSRRASAIKAPVSPLLTTTWDQEAPYNNNCPDFVTGGKCYTGCVATAMAQVMYYEAVKNGKSSTELTTEIPGYNCSTKWNGSFVVTVPAIAAGTTINWIAMKDSYSSTDTGTAADAVALLMQCCGASVKMEYAGQGSANGSTATTTLIPSAMTSYFGYPHSVRFASRQYYNYADWTELVYNELKEGRAVLYDGQSSGGGHAFVVDGYDGDEMFHVNWGWGGLSDSYFALSVMNPHDNSGAGASSSSDGYSYDQNVVIGIDLNGADETDARFSTQGLLIKSSNTVEIAIGNWTGHTQTIDTGLGYYVGDELTLLQECFMNSKLNHNHYVYGDIVLTNQPALAGQTVTLYPVAKLTSESKWKLTSNPHINVVVSYNASGVPTALGVHGFTWNLSATAFYLPGSRFANEKQKVEVTVSNAGDEFFGPLYLFASKSSGTLGTLVSQCGVTVLKNKTAIANFEFTPDASTTYYLTVATDEEGKQIIGTATVDITTNPAVLPGPFILSSVSIDDADGDSWQTLDDGSKKVNVYSQHIVISPIVQNISSTNYNATLYFILYKKMGSTWSQVGSYSGGNSIKAGGFLSFSPMTFNNVGYGEFKFALANGNGAGATVYDERYLINTVKGYTIIDLAGKTSRVPSESAVVVSDDAVAVDLSAFDFTGVTPNSNPNTLYFLSGSQTTPATLDGKNVVKDGVAETVTLTDGTPFYTPYAFRANSISYTRTFDATPRGNTKWNTLVLPFAPTSVTTVSDEVLYNLTWFTAKDQTDRNFWLMQYTGADNSGQVVFDYVDVMAANTPYIIAVPGDEYGNKWSLAGCPITFSATDADLTAAAKAVITGYDYKFVGTTLATGSLEGIYVLNDEGDTFQKGTHSVAPFRAYFAPTTTSAAAAALPIALPGDVSGITTVHSAKTADAAVYNLSGQRVSHPAKGLYIVNGKKVIIK